QRYIELNPVRAGIVSDPADYTWSSYRAHAFGQAVKLWQPHSEYLALGETLEARVSAYREFFRQQLTAQVITDMRDALNKGLILGDDRFRAEVEALTGARLRHLKRGPKSSNVSKA
ncbi:MAG: transposase, partial [Gammaproteobacteria bacterium]